MALVDNVIKSSVLAEVQDLTVPQAWTMGYGMMQGKQ